jgi:hypothetical protein
MAALLLGGLLTMLASPGAAGAVAKAIPARVEGDVVPLTMLRAPSPAGRLYSAGDTVTVFTDSLETLSSPSSENGWTHLDKSGLPTAWHIANDFSCQGLSFWCGVFDSTWTSDADRKGYGNGWMQEASNFVDLTGAVTPVRIGFRHHLNVEQGFDIARVEVLDDDGWVVLKSYSGVVDPPGAALCDTVSFVVPDSIVAASPMLAFRFAFESDVSGSSEDGLYAAAAGWSIDNLTVVAGLSDVRFFDDFEAGLGTWSILTFPPVGDLWRIVTDAATEQLCSSNPTKMWTAASPATSALLPRAHDILQSRPIGVGAADQIFLSFDVFRNLSLSACFYYNATFRHRKVGTAWSGWINPTGLLYFGTEKDWLRQTIPLVGGGGADSVQFRLTIRDYGNLFCGGSATATGTLFLLDNFAIRVIGLAGPSITAGERDLFQDTFRTSVFFVDDNVNTPRGDSLSVRIGASRGLKSAALFYRVGAASFVSTPLLPSAAAPNAFYADVPPGAYPRGTELRYYFSATDSLDEVVTLPADAIGASHYFTATVLPRVQDASAFCAGDTARVLYVNSDAPLDKQTTLETSLAAMGMRYDRYDVNAPTLGMGNGPGGGNPADPSRIWPAVPAGSLAAYSTIVWDVGTRSNATLTAQDQTLLQAWSSYPGKNRNLLIAGDNVAYDLVVNGAGVANFLSCTLGASYLRDIWENTPQDSLQPIPAGAAGTTISGTPFPLNGGCPTLNRFDALGVSACTGGTGRAWVRYPNQLAAMTERLAAIGTPGGDSARAILAGFSFGAMKSQTQLNLLLWRTIAQEFEEPYCSVPTAVLPEGLGEASPSARPRLLGAAPNPFNPHTTIRFELPRAARVRLRIFDVRGGLVRMLADGVLAAGSHNVVWDGRDRLGRRAATGTYFYRMEAEGVADARKLTLLR